MIAHHHVGSNVPGFDEQISALIIEYSDVIVLYTVGHHHLDEFRTVRPHLKLSFLNELELGEEYLVVKYSTAYLWSQV